MIQYTIHKVSRLFHSWMNQQFEWIEWMTQKHIYHHMLAVLVSYLEHNFIKKSPLSIWFMNKLRVSPSFKLLKIETLTMLLLS